MPAQACREVTFILFIFVFRVHSRYCSFVFVSTVPFLNGLLGLNNQEFILPQGGLKFSGPFLGSGFQFATPCLYDGALYCVLELYKTVLFCSFERGSRKGSDADQLGSGWHSAESYRRQHQFLLQCGHMHSDTGGTCALVVREPARALHGAARQARLR